MGLEDQNVEIKIGNFLIQNSSEVKLLGVTIERQLSFLPHVENMCSKAISKIKALVRIKHFLNQRQTDMLYFSYIMSPFNYCPLLWMFCSRPAFKLSNETHHKALKVRFTDFKASFEDLLGFSLSTLIILTH